MAVDDFLRDAREVRDTLTAYKVGYADVLEGDRMPQDDASRKAQKRFMRTMWSLGKVAHADLIYW